MSHNWRNRVQIPLNPRHAPIMRRLICLHDENSKIEAQEGTVCNTRALAPIVTGKYAFLDWFQGTCPGEAIAEIKQVLLNYYPGCDVKTDAKPVVGYHVAEQWTCGLRISWTADFERGHIQLTGTALRYLELTQTMGMLMRICALGVKPTRIDCALDDYDRELTIDWHLNQILKDRLCYFRKVADIGNSMTGQRETIMFGRRGASGSGVYVRVYDKNIESEGEINAIRYEAEFSGNKVERVFGHLLDSPVTSNESISETIAGLVLGSIDYRHKEPKRSISRCERVAEWESFLNCRVTVRVKPQAAAPRSEFNADHFAKQYGRSLQYMELLNPAAISDLLWKCRSYARERGLTKIRGKIVGQLPGWAIAH